MKLQTLLSTRRQTWRRAHEQLDLTLGRQYSLYHDDAAVEAAHVRGILQMFLFAPDEKGHVDTFLTMCNFPSDAHVLDCGCGTGDMASLIRHQRPDVRLTLLNTSMAQLRCCGTHTLVAGDMHALPFPAASFDAMLLCYALGYGAIDLVLSEAARVLKPSGTLVVTDMVAEYGNAEAILLLLGYKCYTCSRLLNSAHRHGLFVCHESAVPILHPMVSSLWPEEDYQELFRDIVPKMIIFTRGESYATMPRQN